MIMKTNSLKNIKLINQVTNLEVSKDIANKKSIWKIEDVIKTAGNLWTIKEIGVRMFPSGQNLIIYVKPHL